MKLFNFKSEAPSPKEPLEDFEVNPMRREPKDEAEAKAVKEALDTLTREGLDYAPDKNMLLVEDYGIEMNELADESVKEGQVGELMEKYGRSELELLSLMKKCEEYLKTDETEAEAVPPYSAKEVEDLSIDDVQDLAIFYRKYLASKSVDGLEFSNEERTRVSETDLKDLSVWRNELQALNFKLAELNAGRIVKPSGQEDEAYLKTTNGLSRVDSLKIKINARQGKVDRLEDKIMTPVEKIDESRLSTDNVRPEIVKDVWKDVPEYSVEELRVMETAVKYLKNRRLPAPAFADGEKLNQAQILESAQEFAEHEAWPKAYFSVQEFKGQRQLVNSQKFYDEEQKTNKQIRYVQFSNENAGQYYYDIDASKFFIDKRNPSFAVAPISVLVTTENPKKFLEKKEAKSEKLETKQAG